MNIILERSQLLYMNIVYMEEINKINQQLNKVIKEIKRKIQIYKRLLVILTLNIFGNRVNEKRGANNGSQ